MESLEQLKKLLSRLPGVGRRSADRMAVSIARNPNGYLGELVAALKQVDEEIGSCRYCGSLTRRDENPCRLCTDTRRDDKIICVVEDPGDIHLIEHSGLYRGRYHALLGRLAPARNDGTAIKRVAELVARVEAGGVQEVLLALNSDVESDATAHYLVEKLHGANVSITRLARGIPAGSGLAYADPVTLEAALKNRTVL